MGFDVLRYNEIISNSDNAKTLARLSRCNARILQYFVRMSELTKDQQEIIFSMIEQMDKSLIDIFFAFFSVNLRLF